jgi:hypothetical protein
MLVLSSRHYSVRPDNLSRANGDENIVESQLIQRHFLRHELDTRRQNIVEIFPEASDHGADTPCRGLVQHGQILVNKVGC